MSIPAGTRLFRDEAHRIDVSWRQGYAAGLEKHHRISPWVKIAGALAALWLIRRWVTKGAVALAVGGFIFPTIALVVGLAAVTVVVGLAVLHHRRLRAARMPLEPPGIVVIPEDFGDGYEPF
jgi:hypothetical protein